MTKKNLSQDEMIKNLLRDYPKDALDFFYPEVLKKYGKITGIDFHVQEVKKHSHYDKNLKNDLIIIYEFEKGKNVLLALIDHTPGVLLRFAQGAGLTNKNLIFIDLQSILSILIFSYQPIFKR